jgi:hypothetical protein
MHGERIAVPYSPARRPWFRHRKNGFRQKEAPLDEENGLMGWGASARLTFQPLSCSPRYGNSWFLLAKTF